MWQKGFLFTGNSKRCQHTVHFGREKGNHLRRPHANPSYTWTPSIRKKSNLMKFGDDLLLCVNGGQRVADLRHFFRRNFANEFERYVQIIRIDPFRICINAAQLANHGCKALTPSRGNSQGHEETHRQGSLDAAWPLYTKCTRTISTAACPP